MWARAAVAALSHVVFFFPAPVLESQNRIVIEAESSLSVAAKEVGIFEVASKPQPILSGQNILGNFSTQVGDPAERQLNILPWPDRFVVAACPEFVGAIRAVASTNTELDAECTGECRSSSLVDKFYRNLQSDDAVNDGLAKGVVNPDVIHYGNEPRALNVDHRVGTEFSSVSRYFSYLDLFLSGAPKSIGFKPQCARKPGYQDGSQQGQRPLILLGGHDGTGSMEFEPDDRFDAYGAFFVKGTIGVVVLLCVLAILKRF
jgi:hypothetical protein